MTDQDRRRAGVTDGSGRVSNRGANLSREDRARGGQRSARLQERDARGHFAGSRKPDSGSEPSRTGRMGNEH
jgi:hypothetical protein